MVPHLCQEGTKKPGEYQGATPISAQGSLSCGGGRGAVGISAALISVGRSGGEDGNCSFLHTFCCFDIIYVCVLCYSLQD